jgi:signal transduction histidine kinase
MRCWGPSMVSTARPQPKLGLLRRSSRAARRQSAYLVGLAVVAALYFGAAQLSYQLQFAGPVAAIVWLPAGVGIAGLYLRGLALWPGVLVGDLLVNDYGALPFGSALGQTAGNVLAIVTAACLLGAVFRRRGRLLGSVAGLAGMVAALAVGAALNATVGVLSLRLGGVVPTDELATAWRTWWLGDLSGELVVIPLAVAWLGTPAGRASRASMGEATTVLVVIAALTQLASHSQRPLFYLVLAALTWAALRLSERAMTLAVTITVALTVWNTVHLQGPFEYDSRTAAVLASQLYIAVAALSTLFLAAVVREREALAGRLGASQALALRAADAERARIERDLHDGAQQRLLALVVHLRLAAERVRDEPEQAPTLFASAESALQGAVDELRQLAHDIHPDVLTGLGLDAAVERLVARSTVPTATVAVPAARFDPIVEATAYHVIAEAVANAERHAQARSIAISLRSDGTALLVDVRDDGIGGARERAGSALEGLRQRVELVGGEFHVDSPPGRGTRVSATITAGVRDTL